MSNSSPLIESIEKTGVRSEPLPEFRPGDTVAVHALISEGGKERIQVFEGVCIHRKGGGDRGSFTVRKVSKSHGVGVERVWPVNSPRVVKVELVNRGKVRRAKLYYLRELRGNATRIQTKLGDYGKLMAKQAEAQEAGAQEQAVEAAAAAEQARQEEAAKKAAEAAKNSEAEGDAKAE